MKPDSPHQILYASSAVRPFSTTELVELLERARLRNTKVGVTGLLLYHDGNFMQLLEGSPQHVVATFDRIKKDPRHTGFITLINEPASKRLFSDWSMAFKKIESDEVRSKPGFSEFLRTTENGERFPNEPAKALRLLLMFREHLR